MAFRPVVSVLVKFMELMGMVDTLNPGTAHQMSTQAIYRTKRQV